MARWGEEIFDSDAASDYLVIIIRQIVEKIEDCLDNNITPVEQATSCGERYLAPGVDILVKLGNAYPDIVVPIIRELSIQLWKEWYLNVFDQSEEGRGDTEFIKDRREIIVRTFNELTQLAESLDE